MDSELTHEDFALIRSRLEELTTRSQALEEVEAAAERAWTAYYSGQRMEAAMSVLCSALHHARRVRQ